jgi:hypothetical protein
MELCSKGRLLALASYIRLGLKRLEAINTLSYYDAELITPVKSFIVQARGENFAKKYFSVLVDDLATIS